MLIARVKFIGPDFVWVHIVAIISPARRLGDDRRVELPGPKSIAPRGRLRRECAVTEQMPLHAIRKQHPKLCALAEFLKEPRRTLIVIERNRVGMDIFEGPLAIPNKKVKFAGWLATARGVPVRGAVPIGIAAIEIQDHKIAETRQIHHFTNGLIFFQAGDAGVGQ